jgi:hypothetical protein
VPAPSLLEQSSSAQLELEDANSARNPKEDGDGFMVKLRWGYGLFVLDNWDDAYAVQKSMPAAIDIMDSAEAEGFSCLTSLKLWIRLRLLGGWRVAGKKIL